MFGLNGNVLFDQSSIYLLANYAIMLIILAIASTPLGCHVYHRWIEGKKGYVLVPVVLMGMLFICSAYIIDASYNPFLYFRI